MKKICIFFLTLLMLTACCFAVQPASAATTMNITSHDEWELISWDDSFKLRWNSVTGASGYYVTIAKSSNGTVTEYLVRNEYTTRTYFTATSYLPEECTQLKVWVGAVASSSDAATSAFTDQIIFLYLAHEPAVTNGGSSAITRDSATLEMSVDRDYGYAIEDCGFYLGTSSSSSSMDPYSFKKYSTSYGATSKGTKYMTIPNLEPGTTYYYRAYAVNEVGEEISGCKSFTTAKGSLADPVISSPADSSICYTGSDIQLRWNSVSGADGYKYYIKQLSGQPDRTDESEPYVKQWNGSTSASRLYYTLDASNLVPGYWYKFVVEACADDAGSGWSDWCYVYVEQGQLETPIILSPDNTATYAGYQSIEFDWEAVECAEEYTYFIKRLKGLPERTNQNEDAWESWSNTTTATSYTLAASKVVPGYWYKFVIEATAANMKPSWSEWVYCYVEDVELEDPYISKPSKWTDVYQGESILVDWDSVAGAEAYTCFIKQLAGEPDTSNNNEPSVNAWEIDRGTSTQYTFGGSNVVGGYWYKFVVKATAGSAESWSNWVYVYVPQNGTLDAPVITAPAASVDYEWGEDIRFTWSRVPNATNYTYYIKQLAGTPDYSDSEASVNSWKGTTSASRCYYTLKGENVQPNTWYKFVVEATADGYDDSWSKYTYVHIPDREDWIHYTFPAAGTLIGDEAFANTTLLRTFNASNSQLAFIGSRAFGSCVNLESINLPATVTYIADDAFANCPQLTIHCIKGSYAESYASSKGFPVVLHGVAESADVLQLSQTRWDVSSAEAAEAIVRVSSSGTWTAASNASWLTLSTASGADGANIVLSAAANTSSSSRSATVTFTCGKVKAMITVTQVSVSAKQCVLDVATDYWEPTSSAPNREIVVRCDAGFSVASNRSWLTFSVKNAAIYAKVASSAFSSADIGTLTVTCSECGQSRTITVAVQKQVVPSPSNVSAGSFEPHAVVLTWSRVSGADYIIERSDDASTWTQLATVNADATLGTYSYTDASNIGACTTHWYRVTARKIINGTAVNSSASKVVSATSKAEVKLNFTGTVGLIGDDGQAKLSNLAPLSWNPLSDVTYRLTLRNANTNTIVDGLEQYSIGTSASFALSSHLKEGTRYKVWVGAFNAAGRIMGQTAPRCFTVISATAAAPTVTISSLSPTTVSNSGYGKTTINMTFSHASAIYVQLLRNGSPVYFYDDYVPSTKERLYTSDDFACGGAASMEAKSWNVSPQIRIFKDTEPGSYTLKVTATGSGGTATASKTLTVTEPPALSADRQTVVNRAYDWYNYTWTTTRETVLHQGRRLAAGTKVFGLPYSLYNGGVIYTPSDYQSKVLDKGNETIEGSYSGGKTPKYGADCTQLVYDCWKAGGFPFARAGMVTSHTDVVLPVDWTQVRPGDALRLNSEELKTTFGHIMLVVAVDYDNMVYTVIEQASGAVLSTTSKPGYTQIGTRKKNYTYGQNAYSSYTLEEAYTPYRYTGFDD